MVYIVVTANAEAYRVDINTGMGSYTIISQLIKLQLIILPPYLEYHTNILLPFH